MGPMIVLIQESKFEMQPNLQSSLWLHCVGLLSNLASLRERFLNPSIHLGKSPQKMFAKGRENLKHDWANHQADEICQCLFRLPIILSGAKRTCCPRGKAFSGVFLFFYFEKCLPVLTKLQTGSQSPLLFLLGLFLASKCSLQQLLPGFISTKKETDWLRSP